MLVKLFLNGFKNNPRAAATPDLESRLKAGCSQDWLPHKGLHTLLSWYFSDGCEDYTERCHVKGTYKGEDWGIAEAAVE